MEKINSHIQSKILDQIPGVSTAFQFPSTLKPKDLYQVHQTHSTDIVVLHSEIKEELAIRKGDGILTDHSKRIGIQTADCMPVLISSSDGRTIAAIHAGWRGLLDGILSKTIQLLVSLKISPENLVIAIGPHIRSCCFEVSRDLLDRFELRWKNFNTVITTKQNQPSSTQSYGGDFWIDLSKLASAELRSHSIPENKIEVLQFFTYCGKNDLGIKTELASYRRHSHSEQKNEKYQYRQWSWIQKF